MVDVNSVSNSVNNYYNQVGTQATNVARSVSNGASAVANSQVGTTIASMPSDQLQIGATSLATGISVSAQIVSSRRGEIPDDGTRFHASGSVLKTGRNAAIVGGLISTSQNLYEFVQGKVSGAVATGNITADVAGAFGSGIVAAGAGTLATTMIRSTMGAGVLGLVVGAAAFAGTDFLYRNSGIYTSVSSTVSTFITNVMNRIKPGGGW